MNARIWVEGFADSESETESYSYSSSLDRCLCIETFSLNAYLNVRPLLAVSHVWARIAYVLGAVGPCWQSALSHWARRSEPLRMTSPTADLI